LGEAAHSSRMACLSDAKPLAYHRAGARLGGCATSADAALPRPPPRRNARLRRGEGRRHVRCSRQTAAPTAILDNEFLEIDSGKARAFASVSRCWQFRTGGICARTLTEIEPAELDLRWPQDTANRSFSSRAAPVLIPDIRCEIRACQRKGLEGLIVPAENLVWSKNPICMKSKGYGSRGPGGADGE
jgi:hypothetical protein